MRRKAFLKRDEVTIVGMICRVFHAVLCIFSFLQLSQEAFFRAVHINMVTGYTASFGADVNVL